MHASFTSTNIKNELAATWLLTSFICLSSNGRRQTENGEGMSDGNRCLFSLMNRARLRN